LDLRRIYVKMYLVSKKEGSMFRRLLKRFFFSKNLNFIVPIIVEKDELGYFAQCPLFTYAVGGGETIDEAINEVIEAVEIIIIYRMMKGKPIEIAVIKEQEYLDKYNNYILKKVSVPSY